MGVRQTDQLEASTSSPSALQSGSGVEARKNFRAFCANDSDIRRGLTEPFSIGAYTYATNGHIAVRLPRCEEVPEGNEDRAYNAAAIDKMLSDRIGAQVPTPFERKLPDIEEGGECELCDGTGKGHPDCPDCDCDCDDCNGTGEWHKRQRVRFDGYDVDVKYLRMIIMLPEAKIAIGKSERNDWPLLFSFDGGFGVVMPMMQHNYTHDEIFEFADLPLATDAQSQIEEPPLGGDEVDAASGSASLKP